MIDYSTIVEKTEEKPKNGGEFIGAIIGFIVMIAFFFFGIILLPSAVKDQPKPNPGKEVTSYGKR